MADTFTTNLNLTKPEPGAAEDTWGISLNSDLDALDAIFSSSGTQVNLNPNQVNFADGKKAIFGTGSDLQIFHDGTHSVIDDVGTGNLILQTNGTQITLQSSSEYFVTAQNNGAVTLYHNGSSKLATTSLGIDVTGRVTSDGLTSEGTLGTWTIQNNGYVQNFDRAGANIIRASNASGSLRFDTGGSTIRQKIGSNGDISFYDDTGTSENMVWDASDDSLNFVDSAAAHFGTGNDLRIYHDGTNGSINNFTGDVLIRQNTNDRDVLIQSDNGSGGLSTYFRADGSTGEAKLYNYGALKLTTKSDGIDVSGVASTTFGVNIIDPGNTAYGGHLSYDDANSKIVIGGVTNNTKNVAIAINRDNNNVGLGTTAPSSKFHVKLGGIADDSISLVESSGSSTYGVYIKSAYAEEMGRVGALSQADGGLDGASIAFRDYGRDIAFNTHEGASNSEKVRIKKDGNVGIGTSVPNYALDVRDDSNIQLKLASTTTTNNARMVYAINNITKWNIGVQASDSSYTFYDNSSATTPIKIESGAPANTFVLKSSGRLGLNTTNPTTDLEVNTTGANGIKITSDQPYLFFNDTDNTGTTYDSSISFSGNSMYIGGASAASIIRFRNKASFGESARIDTSGNLLVGTTNNFPPGDSGNEGVAIKPDNIAISRNNSTPLFLDRMTSDGVIVDLRKDNSTVGKLRSYGGDLIIQNEGTGLRFQDGVNAIHPVVSVGSVSDNLTDLGLTNARFKDLHLGGNIILSGTSANEGYIALPDSDLPTSTTHKLYHSNDTLYWNGESIDTTSTSDYRAKKDIQPLKDGLQRVNKLNPVEFRYIEDDKYSEGFIAHELQEVWEHGVHGEKDGDIMQSVSYGRITPLLVKAIQEQQEQIESLKSEIAKLKGE